MIVKVVIKIIEDIWVMMKICRFYHDFNIFFRWARWLKINRQSMSSNNIDRLLFSDL